MQSHTLWGQAKDVACVNTQYTDIDEQADAFIAHVSGLSNRKASQTSGVLSEHFWLRRTLSRYFCGHQVHGYLRVIAIERLKRNRLAARNITPITTLFAQTLANAISKAVSGITRRCSMVPCSRSRNSAAPVRMIITLTADRPG